MSFGQHLRGLREGAGLSRAALARKAGIPVSTLRNWEGDRGMPGVPAARRLADVLGVSVERLAEGVGDELPARALSAGLASSPAPRCGPHGRGRA
jgi:transcriptional regulator with XRE-family HTH domain